MSPGWTKETGHHVPPWVWAELFRRSPRDLSESRSLSRMHPRADNPSYSLISVLTSFHAAPGSPMTPGGVEVSVGYGQCLAERAWISGLDLQAADPAPPEKGGVCGGRLLREVSRTHISVGRSVRSGYLLSKQCNGGKRPSAFASAPSVRSAQSAQGRGPN
jgi:hypothetical protein